MALSVNFFIEKIGALAEIAQKTTKIGPGDLNYRTLVPIFLVFVLGIISFTIGRSRAIASLLSLYIASFLFFRLPYVAQIEGLAPKIPYYAVDLILFFVLFVISYIALSRILPPHKHSKQESSFGHIILLFIAQLTALAVVLVDFLPQEIISQAHSSLGLYSQNKIALFIGAIFPLAVIFFLKTKLRRNGV